MGFKGGLQKLHKFNGIFKEFQSTIVNLSTQFFKILSIFALGSLGRQNMYLCSGSRLKLKNIILIKIIFHINFCAVFGAHQHPLELVINGTK